MLKLVKDSDEYYLPHKRKHLNTTCLKAFLENSISAYSAAQVLFGKDDNTLMLIDYPIDCAQYANIFISNSNMKMLPFKVPELYNENVLFYFPIEWIKEHFIYTDVAVKYNETYDSFYLKKVNTSSVEGENIESCLHSNIEILSFAIKNKRVNEIYELFIAKSSQKILE